MMKKLLIHLFLAPLLVCSLMSSSFAQKAEDALATVKQSVDVVLADLKANKSEYQRNPAALNRMIDSKMLPYFDVDVMARLVLAKNWRDATETQRQMFLDEFKQLIMRTYSSSLLDYTDATVEYGKPSKVNRNRTKIDTTVINSDGKRYELTLSMGYRNGQWKAYDVSMDGLSVITSYRSSMGEEVSQKGLQQVIDEIKALNAKGAVKR